MPKLKWQRPLFNAIEVNGKIWQREEFQQGHVATPVKDRPTYNTVAQKHVVSLRPDYHQFDWQVSDVMIALGARPGMASETIPDEPANNLWPKVITGGMFMHFRRVKYNIHYANVVYQDAHSNIVDLGPS